MNNIDKLLISTGTYARACRHNQTIKENTDELRESLIKEIRELGKPLPSEPVFDNEGFYNWIFNKGIEAFVKEIKEVLK